MRQLLVLLASAFLVPVHAAEPGSTNVPILTHPEAVVTQLDLAAAMAGAPADQVKRVRESLTSAENQVTDLLLRRLLAQRAQREGLDKDPFSTARLKLVSEKALFDLYMESAEKRQMDEAKIEKVARDEYKAYPERYTVEEVRVRHVLVRDCKACGSVPYEAAEALRKQVLAGSSLEELAKLKSDDPGSGRKGGDIGWVTKDKVVPAFAEAAFALKQPGDISPVVKTEFGYHVIQLIDRRGPRLLPFDEVKEPLLNSVRNNLRTAVRSDILQGLKSPENTRIDSEALKAVLSAQP